MNVLEADSSPRGAPPKCMRGNGINIDKPYKVMRQYGLEDACQCEMTRTERESEEMIASPSLQFWRMGEAGKG